ncbi:hypothetical protein LX82_01732 [Celeribacter halophilus]|uniref:Uncharacterized protein n=1 Tax=Celeribacter halophilus TaxID=576117 RepID=A0A1I3S2G8_9RHOB|nr:hypothetical protein LX82_01732 [Celeribacter halophilus]SFJ52808.1 hypothetical protein SAMN04488138_10610 [Celeribacter halophilus]
MLIGLLVISTLAAIAATVLGFSMGFPTWSGLIIFSCIGTATFLISAIVIYVRLNAKHRAQITRKSDQRKTRTGAIGKGHQRQHHGHFDQNANHRGECRTGIQTKEADGHGNG